MVFAINQLLKSSIKYLPAIATKLAITTLIAVLPLPVKAVTLVTSRADFASNDGIDWSSLGKVFNPFAPNPSTFLPNSFSAVSESGLGLNVTVPQVNDPSITPPFVFQTSFIPKGIPTNFADGDYLLFTGFNPRSGFPAVGNPGPLTISFDRPVFGAGTQIAVDDIPEFNVFVSAFDSGNNLLGSFSVPGTSSVTLDNSALFLGINSETANISRLVFSTSESNRAFAINRVSIIAVPEPNYSVAILVFGVSGVMLRVRKRS
ncbi:MAG: hypothetical protein RMZ41_018760 [Nostoc sp. DedVER02]|uniref:hypothetical protein n=1 Tax=unclassified Nostoc TaxID=2593658 RepID=UPI002AD4ED9C|nr:MULTISPECIES: hypothetical protein [unclassified Nostoc]MDZ7985082.1 hypothetical protein [Nostoc sp. DedVER02]MDZ8112815.1 hypothetical protein [Nostoc sp. DedVER01b]